MNRVACCLAGHNFQFVLHRNLPQEVPPTKSDLAGQHCFAILRHPDQMDFQVALRGRIESIVPHATTLHQPCFAGRRGGSTIPEGDTNHAESFPVLLSLPARSKNEACADTPAR